MKIGLLLATTCLAGICGLSTSDAAVTLVSVNTGMFGTGFTNVATFASLAVSTPEPFTTAGLTFTGDGIVRKGSAPNVYQAPTGDTGNYLALANSSGSETISLANGQSGGKFGLYWGSIDKYNTITFFSGTTDVGSFSGGSVPGLTFDSHGNSGESAFVSFAGTYSSVVLSTTQPNFEVDNVSVGGVPEASTWAMMLVGFGGLGLFGYSRNRRRDDIGMTMATG